MGAGEAPGSKPGADDAKPAQAGSPSACCSVSYVPPRIRRSVFLRGAVGLARSIAEGIRPALGQRRASQSNAARAPARRCSPAPNETTRHRMGQPGREGFCGSPNVMKPRCGTEKTPLPDRERGRGERVAALRRSIRRSPSAPLQARARSRSPESAVARPAHHRQRRPWQRLHAVPGAPQRSQAAG